MKRVVSMLMALMLCAAFVFCTSAQAFAFDSGEDRTVVVTGKTIEIGETRDLGDEYTCTTFVSPGDEESEIGPLALTDRSKTKTFINLIHNKNGAYICTLQVVVKGMYSPTDRTSAITSLNYMCSGLNSMHMSISKNVSGNTAVLRLYYFGQYIGKLTYTIYYNGNIEQS